MPPLAVVAPLTDMLLPLLVVTDNEPAPSALASSCRPPVCEIVIDPPPVVLANCPAAAVKLVAAVPVLRVKVLLVVNVPLPVITWLPLTPNVIPPLAVTLLAPKATLPEELVKLKLPEPRARAPDDMPPVALTVNELGVPEIVPIARAVAPWVTFTLPVSLTFRVATLDETVVAPLPEVRDRAPVDVSTPEPLIVALPLVPVDKVIPPFAVTVPLTEILLAFVVREKDPAPSLFVFS
jgi:hypothetical protein